MSSRKQLKGNSFSQKSKTIMAIVNSNYLRIFPKLKHSQQPNSTRESCYFDAEWIYAKEYISGNFNVSRLFMY